MQERKAGTNRERREVDGAQHGDKKGEGRESQMHEQRVGGEEAGDKTKGWMNIHGGRDGDML